MGRLITIHGHCWGVGQSTLCRRLAAALANADVLWEDELSQPAIFTRPEFAEVAAQFHEHNAHPAGGIGHPSPTMLEAAYAALVRRALPRDEVVLMGWSPMDLAEDLDWARADEAALHAHIRAVRDLMQPLEPVLVYLDADIGAALDRVVAQRGRAWFAGEGALDDERWERRRTSLVAEANSAAIRIRKSLEVAEWVPTVEVDGTARSADEVFDLVTSALRRNGIDVRPPA